MINLKESRLAKRKGQRIQLYSIGYNRAILDSQSDYHRKTIINKNKKVSEETK